MKAESPYAPNPSPTAAFSPFLRRLLYTILGIAGLVAMVALVALVHFVFFSPGYRSRPKDLRARGDISAMESGLETYRVENGSLPSQALGLDALVKGPKPWVKELPEDPWRQDYCYEFPARRSSKPFDLYSRGPDRLAGTADDIGNWKK